MRNLMLLASALTAATAAHCFAAAQPVADYPQRPVRVIVPYAPGGATDIVARILAPKLSERLKQQFVVDNRAGAAGNIAVELVATAQPDGYTILVGNISTNSINPLLFASKLKVDAMRDLAGVTLLASIPNAIVGGPKVPGTTLKEAIAYIKDRPGQFNFQAPLGSYSHLDMLALTAAAGLKMTHLPSRGAGETPALCLSGLLGPWQPQDGLQIALPPLGSFGLVRLEAHELRSQNQRARKNRSLSRLRRAETRLPSGDLFVGNLREQQLRRLNRLSCL